MKAPRWMIERKTRRAHNAAVPGEDRDPERDEEEYVPRRQDIGERVRRVREQAEQEAALKAEQKAARDARYAARKAAKKERRRGY